MAAIDRQKGEDLKQSMLAQAQAVRAASFDKGGYKSWRRSIENG